MVEEGGVEQQDSAIGGLRSLKGRGEGLCEYFLLGNLFLLKVLFS